MGSEVVNKLPKQHEVQLYSKRTPYYVVRRTQPTMLYGTKGSIAVSLLLFCSAITAFGSGSVKKALAAGR